MSQIIRTNSERLNARDTFLDRTISTSYAIDTRTHLLQTQTLNGSISILDTRDLRIGGARNEEARDGKTSEKKREKQRKLRKNILKLIKISNNTYSWTGSNNR